jgi:hypothetical protein
MLMYVQLLCSVLRAGFVYGTRIRFPHGKYISSIQFYKYHLLQVLNRARLYPFICNSFGHGSTVQARQHAREDRQRVEAYIGTRHWACYLRGKRDFLCGIFTAYFGRYASSSSATAICILVTSVTSILYAIFQYLYRPSTKA